MQKISLYDRVGYQALRESYGTLLLILAGDFNISFLPSDGHILTQYL